MSNGDKRRPTNLSSTAKKAYVIRALPGNKFALDNGVIAEIGPEVNGITIGSFVLYVRGGPGINNGFTKIIGYA